MSRCGSAAVSPPRVLSGWSTTGTRWSRGDRASGRTDSSGGHSTCHGAEAMQWRLRSACPFPSVFAAATSGWPTTTAIALVVGRDRSTVAQHFRNPRFDAWFDEACDKFFASSRSKARAKFAALAMAGSVPVRRKYGRTDDGAAMLQHTNVRRPFDVLLAAGASREAAMTKTRLQLGR